MYEYKNVPATIGMVVSRGMATMAEVSTVLSLEDVYDLIEIAIVDDYNKEIIQRRNKGR